MADRVKVATLTDVPPGALKDAQVGSDYIVLANVEGTIYALADECTHQYCSLSDGELQGHTLVCPCHGGGFDVRTGAAERLPVVTPVATYAVVVQGDDVLIES